MPTEKELKYNNIKEYLNFISKFPRSSFPLAGGFYVYTYAFHANPDFRKLPQEKKKIYDFQPCQLILYTNPQKKYFVGLNWHFLSVEARKLLLNKLIKIYPKIEDMSRVRIPGMNYRKLFRILRKIGVGIRRYKFSRVLKMRFVPGDQIETLLQFHARFYYATTYQFIANQYRKYRPKAN